MKAHTVAGLGNLVSFFNGWDKGAGIVEAFEGDEARSKLW